MDNSKACKYKVWALASTAPEWIEWCPVGEADSIEEAQEIGSNCGWKCWRIRLSTEKNPSYVVNGMDDGRWVE